jgi:hypothetical protein
MSTTQQRRRTIRVIERSTLESQLRVDRKRSVICGVKVLGFTSLNGRQYLPEAVKAAAKMYEGILVNVDHPEAGAEDSRSAYDRCGKLVNVRYIEGKGLYADLQLLKGHPITERVLNAAETMPEAYGLSHNAQGEGDEDEQGVFIVRKISGVRHVDLVADPATTRGLAESKNRRVREAGHMADETSEPTNPLASHIADVLDQEGLDTPAKVERILSLVALANGAAPAEDEMEMDDPAVDDKKAMEGDGEEYPSKDAEEEEEEPLSKDDKKPMESRRYARLSSELASLREQIERTKREADVRRICESASLTLDKQLLADLMQLPADSMVRHVKRLAESAAVAARATKPRTLMPIQESVQTGIPKDVFSWLKD